MEAVVFVLWRQSLAGGRSELFNGQSVGSVT